ncbi:MAG: WYL domain-containing protein [Campylobacterota bacterium]
MKESSDKIATRLAQILTKLNNGERLTVKELEIEFNVGDRTIQRDLNERLSYIPIIKEKGYYYLPDYALGKLSFNDIKNFATLSGIKSLYPKLSHSFIVDILNAKINKAYLIKNQGFEDISYRYDWFEDVSNAILNTFQIEFSYNDKKRVVNPYKLINNNGIWYLLGDEDNKLKNYTFSKIKNLKLIENNQFTPTKDFIDKIEQNDTNWFSENLIEVVLEIDNSIKEYILRKDIFPNKKIIEQTDDRFVLSTNISYDEEILGIVKYWLPYIKIVSPIYLQDKLKNILKEYLE